MERLPVVIFLLTYLGVAVGRVPGLTLDRTGIALLGAIAMVVSGTVPLPSAMAAIDLPTIVLLYALMIISAQLRLGGFYTKIAASGAAWVKRPASFLGIAMLLAAALSALLANDIICLAFTPVLIQTLAQAGLNPLPYLLGLAVSSNIGSAATIIGNPQNMLIGQVGQLSFSTFLLHCLPPTLFSLAGAYAIILALYRKHLHAAAPPGPAAGDDGWPEFDRAQTMKGIAAVLLLVASFCTAIPRELSAITIAALLLCSRKMRSRRILELIDWHLLTLFCALFIVVKGIESQELPARILAAGAAAGIELTAPATLTALSALLSNLVSNVPAVMLLVELLDPAQATQWYTLALSSTFAGNLLLIGSIANLIVVEQASRAGVDIGTAEHARVGIPVTLFSLTMLLLFL